MTFNLEERNCKYDANLLQSATFTPSDTLKKDMRSNKPFITSLQKGPVILMSLHSVRFCQDSMRDVTENKI